jgi:hypothetical protein
MNKKNFLTILGFCLILIFSGAFLIQNKIVNGEEIENVNNVENIESEITEGDINEWQDEMGNESENENGESFSDYYKFGSIKVDLQSERASYVPGDKIKFSGTITNTNFYPIINGEVYVRIFQENEINARKNGDYVIDEFFVLENINLMPSEKKNVNFNWNIPPSAFKGDYKLATFFTVDKKYNMSGLSFTSNVYASFCTFEIKGNNQGRIIFDRNNAKFNNEPYLFRSYIPQLTSKDKAEISILLNNTYNVSKNVRITYDLYSWDALSEENKVKSDSEDLVIGPNSYRTIKYSLDGFDLSVYLLKITAISKTDKSIVDIRFSVNDIPMARINYAGITKFPLVKGEKAKAFVCFHGVNDSGFNGKIDLNLKDNGGNIIASKEYRGNITGDVMLETADISANQNLSLLNLESELSDANRKVIDSFSGTYDISKLSPGYVEETSEKENKTGIYIVLFLLLIIVSAIYFFKKRKLKPVFILILLLIGASLIFCLVENIKKETEITQAEEGIGEFSQTIGTYRIRATHRDYKPKPEIHASLDVYYEIFLKQGDRILKSGDKISSSQPIKFVFNKEGEWHGIGSSWDTPSPYWIDTELYPINDPRTMDTFHSLIEKGCEEANKFWKIAVSKPPPTGWEIHGVYTPLVIKNPNYQLETSDNIDCLENICNVTGNGNVSITATIDKTYFQQIIAIKDFPESGDCTYHTSKIENKICMAHKVKYGYEEIYYDMLPIESVSKTWNFVVEENENPIAQIQCSISDCATFKNELFTLLNKSFDNKTPDDKLKSVWIIIGIGNPFYQRTECENKCDYSIQNLPIGNYSAYLRVEDEEGLSDETTKNFKIKENMKIGFQCSLDNLNWESCSSIAALVNQEIFFKDISKPSEGANINVRDWTFEDGNPSENKGNNEPNPSAEFISEGIKEIPLKIGDSAGQGKTASENIEVFLTEDDIIKVMPNWREVSPKW